MAAKTNFQSSNNKGGGGGQKVNLEINAEQTGSVCFAVPW